MNNDQEKARALSCLGRLIDYLNNRVGGMTKAERVEIWEIEDYIKRSSAPATLEWIPISKAVPEEKGEYITTTFYGSVFCDYWDGDSFDRSEYIIAWMKKPAPFVWEGEE